MEEREETPGSVRTDDRPYDTIEESDEIPESALRDDNP
jgi:hypothetical protein